VSAVEVPHTDVREAFASILQARLSWPSAEACAADLTGYLQRHGLVVFREYHPDEVVTQPRCCAHGPADHDQHGCAVDVSLVRRTYERCHGLVSALPQDPVLPASRSHPDAMAVSAQEREQ
jgi:hypothetical protein